MDNIISLETLLELAKRRKTPAYFYVLRKNRITCFTGNYIYDINNANMIIRQVECNNTAHKRETAFHWLFDQFYGINHNHKLLAHRPWEVSKLTTRLDKKQIKFIDSKFEAWINFVENQQHFAKEHIRHVRTRMFNCYKSLLASGMRLGELCDIDFKTNPASRFIVSKFSNTSCAEVIINTEKTCKKREIYIPEDSYWFFVNDNRKLTRQMLVDGFIQFRNFAGLQFRFTAHVLRRTFATMAYGIGIDVPTIAMCLGNTPEVCMRHYIISSDRNYDAFDVVNAYTNDHILKTNNLFFNQKYLSKKEKQDEKLQSN